MTGEQKGRPGRAAAGWGSAPVEPPAGGPAGGLVRLEPLGLQHAAGWLEAAWDGAHPAAVEAGEDDWRWTSLYLPRDLGEAREQIARALAMREGSARLALAQLDRATGRLVGSTSYYAQDAQAGEVAIGFTWLSPAFIGRGHNADSKLQMLTHAFEVWGAQRVVWHVDALNARSQAAVLRLGARHEATLPRHRQRRDGSWRDTWQAALSVGDWPAARSTLQRRVRAAVAGRSR